MKYKNRNPLFALLQCHYFMPPDGGGDAGDAGGGDDGAGIDDGGGEDTPSPLIGDDLNFSPDWQSRVGESAEGLTHTNLPDLAKSAREARTKIGELTSSNAELTKQLESIGGKKAEMPNTVEEYAAKLTLPEGTDIPEGVEVPQGMIDAGVAFAIEKGYTPDIVSDFISFQISQAGEQFASEKAQMLQRVEESKATITNIVGPQNFETTVSDAQAASEILGLELESNDLIQNPRLVIALSKVKDQLSPGALKGAGLGTPQTATAEGKLTQANDILTNPENKFYEAFLRDDHVNHEAAVAEYNRLIFESGQP